MASNQDDPSRYKKRLDSQLEKLSVLNAQNEKTARRIIRKGRDDDVWKDSTARNHARNLRFLIKHGEKQPEYPDDATEWDSDTWNKIVDDLAIERDVGTGQKREYAYAARAFARFSIDSKAEKDDINAPTYTHSPITKDDVLSITEVIDLVESASNPRDQALIAIMYEAALRRGAIVQLDVGDYTDKRNWGTIEVPDKPGVKTAANAVKPISWSRGYLERWLSAHPDSDNPDAPLFCSIRDQDQGKRLTTQAIYTQFKRIVERSEFDVDDVHPHLLRHSRATHMRESPDHGRSDIEHVLDWDDGTSMHDRYEHAAQYTEAERVAINSGTNVEQESPKSLETCPQCRTTIPPDVSQCPVCLLEFSTSAPDWFDIFSEAAAPEDPLMQKWGDVATGAPDLHELNPKQHDHVYFTIGHSIVEAQDEEHPVIEVRPSDPSKYHFEPYEGDQDEALELLGQMQKIREEVWDEPTLDSPEMQHIVFHPGYTHYVNRHYDDHPEEV